MDTTRYTYAGTDLKPQVIKGETRREACKRALAESMGQPTWMPVPFEYVPPIPVKRRVCFFWWR